MTRHHPDIITEAVTFRPRFSVDYYSSSREYRLAEDECRSIYPKLLELWEEARISIQFATICADNDVNSNAAYSWLYRHGYRDRLNARSGRLSRDLTPQQREISCLIACSHSHKQIAQKLHTSVRTVESIRYRLIRRTLGFSDTASITRYCLAKGWIENEFALAEATIETVA